MISFEKAQPCQFDPTKNWSFDFLKIDTIKKDHMVNGKLLDGHGVRVCIIDTGFSDDVEILKKRKVNSIDMDTCMSKQIMNSLPNLDSGHDIVDHFKKNEYCKPIKEDSSSKFHGSEVMSFIASEEGIAPKCDLYFAKVYEKDPSNSRNITLVDNAIALSIFWALSNCVKVINISSVKRKCSEFLNLAVNEAYERGTIVISGSGNSSPDDPSEVLSESVEFPGAFQKTLAIGAFDRDFDLRRSGGRGRLVDFRGPGIEINSLIKKDRLLTGSSFASALIAGVVILFIEKWRYERSCEEIDYQTLKELLVITSVRPIGDFSHLGWAYGIVYPQTLFGVFNKNINDLIEKFKTEMQALIHRNICEPKN